MPRLQELLKQFETIASNPVTQLEAYSKQGKKAIGCFPYYVPEELVHAGKMAPFGIWGMEGTVRAAKEYFAPFYCTIVQMGLEMALNGKLHKLSGVIIPSLCDTLRPLTQNFRAAIPEIPMIFLAHPQNRKPAYGVEYTRKQYQNIRTQLENIAGEYITDAQIQKSIIIYNKNRAARRHFVKIAANHPETINPIQRSAVLKSAYFMLKEEHTALLDDLNREIESLPGHDANGYTKIVTSGILADSKSLLQIFAEQKFVIAADDVAQESRSYRVDAEEGIDPVLALAKQFAEQDDDPVLYDPAIYNRPQHVVTLVKSSGAKGIVILMMQFCDPEEMEYPSMKKALDDTGIPSVLISYDQQMQDFAQARTQLQAFADILHSTC
jgi:benzoyl-CoA reductase/2-hydroxyglutaryl-CoA dehydratase subunit BcrC/BadD/HgdB